MKYLKIVTNMTSMFQNASNFNQNIRIWNVPKRLINELFDILMVLDAMISEYIGLVVLDLQIIKPPPIFLKN